MKKIPADHLDTITTPPAAWTRLTRHERNSAYIFCRETVEAGSALHARMFAPRLGVYEDPETGSAAAAFGGALLRFGRPSMGSTIFPSNRAMRWGSRV